MFVGTPSTMQPRLVASMPSPIAILGWIALPGALAFAARLSYEQGLLTWRQGPQMVGFSLIHVHPGLFIFLVGSVLFGHLYLLSALVTVIIRAIRKRSTPRIEWLQIVLVFFCVSLAYVPYSVWQVAIIRIAGSNGKAAEYICPAAAQGQEYVVTAVLSEGTSPDIRSLDGQTALDAACVGKQPQMVAYLLSKGATLDLAPDCPGSHVAGRIGSTVNPNLPEVPGTVVEVH